MCSMSDVRRHLGIVEGGPRAMAVVAALAGTDYDLDGASGVGSIGGLAVAKHLLAGNRVRDKGRFQYVLYALVGVAFLNLAAIPHPTHPHTHTINK
jgi:hypothetical protein